MSVLLRHPHTGEIVLYSKGADTTMLAALSPSDENAVASTSIRHYLQSYARQGLRTLVMAKRTLTPQEYETWRQKHEEAEIATENRERRIRDSYATLESHLTLLGTTGIEDKLQTGVPETMAALVAAGIVVWVLTGEFRTESREQKRRTHRIALAFTHARTHAQTSLTARARMGVFLAQSVIARTKEIHTRETALH